MKRLKRVAIKKEQICGVCKKIIILKEQYYDTDVKTGKKPWETQKLCLTCGDKIIL